MHITHVIPTLSFGGAERTVVDIINNAPKEFTFSVLVFFDDIPLKRQITRKNVKVVCVNKKGQLSLGLFGDIRRALQKLNPDVVHTHLFGADLWGRVAARQLGIPVVSTEHNIVDNDGFLKSLIKRVLKNYSTVSVACSEKVKEYMMRYYGMSQNIEVIRPGVNVKQFSALPLPVFGTPLKFVIVGRLTAQKAHATALHALSKVQGDWTLSIVGNGPLEKELRQLVSTLGLQDRVEFFPASSHIEKVYAAHDVVLMPSRWEGLAIVAMEALSSARPLLVSHVGGMSEIIEDGVNGFLLPPTVDAFAKKIQWCFVNKQKLLSTARKARTFAEKNCSVEKMVAEYVKIYSSIKL